MASQDRTISIQLSPATSAAELRLDDFLEQLGTVRQAFRETERYLSGKEPSLHLRIASLQKSSPAVVVLEAVGSEEEPEESGRGRAYASLVVRTMTTNLRVIAQRKRLPIKVDMPVIESYRKLTTAAEKYNVEVQIKTGPNSVLINRKFREILDSIVGDDEYSYGSVSGTIEAINLHDKTRRFWLYPTVGASRILGTFRSRDRKRYADAVDKYVTVFGKLSYKSWDKFPYAIAADDITVHDVSVHAIDDIRGMAPEATGKVNSREFIDNLRDEW